jgi:ribonuclease HII
MSTHKYLIGIDEVGRGPIAGPVAVGAFVFLVTDAKKYFRGVKESKQLSEEKREEWYKVIKSKSDQKLVAFSVCFQSEKVIDTKGLSFAIKKCLETCLKNLKINPEECLVLLDGGLRAPAHFKNQKTIIKGDAKETVIALASICAKVERDRKMKKLGKKYPAYGFEIHKGYGTKAHYRAIEKEGLHVIHRRSFCRKFTATSP